MRHELRRLVLACLLLLALPVLARQEAKPGQLSDQGRLNLDLAYSYLEANDLARSLDRATKATLSDPQSPDARALIGMIQNRLGNQEQAAAAFGLALKLGPDNGSVRHAYGAWLCEHGSTAEADLHFQKALGDPNTFAPRNVLLNAGRCASMANDQAKAEQYLRRALEFSANDAAVLLLLAKVKHAQGQFFEARAFLQRREALGPMSAKAYELAAEIEAGAGDEKSAERYRTLLREKFPEHQSPTGEGAGRP